MARFSKIHGSDISLSKDDTLATRDDYGILFSSSVLSKGETFSVNVKEAGEVSEDSKNDFVIQIMR